MLIIRSMIDGSVLGIAANLEIATVMAQANDWPSWHAVEAGATDFSVLPSASETKP